MSYTLSRCNPRQTESPSKHSPSGASRTARALVWKTQHLPHSLLLDISGIAHLFGGELPLIRRLQRELIATRLEVRIAIGDSVGTAWAAAHYWAGAENPLVIPCGQFDILFDLPLEGLRLGESVVQRLHRLGFRTIRQILSLNRSSLPLSFWRRDQSATRSIPGEQAEPIVHCRPVPKFQAEHFFEDGITQPEIIDKWWSMLLERLVGLLQELQMGTRHLQCAFITEQRSQHDITIRLCEAVADARHIGDLLRLKIEWLRFDAPLIGIRMEALETSVCEQPATRVVCQSLTKPCPPTVFIAEPAEQSLGAPSGRAPRLLPEAVPERAYEYIPVTEKSFPATTRINHALLPLDRPTCLFPHRIRGGHRCCAERPAISAFCQQRSMRHRPILGARTHRIGLVARAVRAARLLPG